ncbi:MAG: hypothetical protein EPN26_02700 [Rhodospirillales bacterium]|nr:MAG: hypothetical protein EPN26_02700 [Rhodospirillales bacterium]
MTAVAKVVTQSASTAELVVSHVDGEISEMDETPSLWDDLYRHCFPTAWLRKALAQVDLGPPEKQYDLQDREDQVYFRYILPLAIVEKTQSRNAPIYAIGKLVEESNTSNIEVLDIRQLYGLSASKSNPRTLRGMAAKIDFERLFQSYRDIDAVAASVIGATSDCVSLLGQPVQVYRQAWDGRMYIGQEGGGSHRFSAVWRWHTERQIPRMLDCDVREIRPTARAIAAASQYRYWFCSSLANLSFLPDGPFSKPTGIMIQAVSRNASTQLVACPRGHRQESILNGAMRTAGAVDLSAFILETLNGASSLQR